MTDSLSITGLLPVINGAVSLGATLLVQTTLILAAGFGVLHLLRKHSAAAQSLALRAFLAAALLCPLAAMILHITGVPRMQFTLMPAILSRSAETSLQPALAPKQGVIPSPSRPAVKALPSEVKAPAVHDYNRSAPAAGTGMTPIPPVGTLSGSHRSDLSPTPRHPLPALPNPRALFYTTITLLWAGAGLVLLLRLLIHHLAVLRLRRTAFPAKPSFEESCARAATELGLTPPLLLQHPEVYSPFLAGLFRPCILLPLGEGELTLNERAVFLHELAHLSRRDTLWNLLSYLATAIMPFQPLLWILARRIEETSDFVCDDFVMHHTGSGRTYAASLLETAWAFQPSHRETIAGVGFVSVASSLRLRIARILDTSRAISLRVGNRLLVLVSSFCLCITFLSGLIGFRGKSFGQGGKFSEVLSRGGKAVTLSVLPLIGKPANFPIKSAGNPDIGLETDPREAIASPDEPSIPGNEPDTNSRGVSETSEESPAETISIPPSPLPVETTPVLSAAPEPAPVRNFAAPVTKYTVARESADTQSASPFLAPVLTGSGYLPVDSGVSEDTVPTGQLMVIAREQETYSGLKSNLDWGKLSPIWSPDGKTIAFTEYTGFGIWMNPAGGGELQLLYTNRGEWEFEGRKFGGGNMRTLCFTPDGRNITIVNYVFDRTRGSRVDFSDGGVVVFGIVPVIEMISTITGRKSIIAMNVVDGCWTPDGETFIGVTEPEGEAASGQIIRIDIATETVRVLAESGASPSVTPDGSTVVFSDGHTLRRVPLAGGEPEKLSVEGYLWNPRCSPDGVWILGTGNRDGSAHTWLRAYNLKTGKTLDLLSQGSRNLEMGSWSPNGKQFCYTLSNPNGNDGSAINIADFDPETNGAPASEAEQAPAPFKLIGNYPNPFNPSTTIEFSLPSSGRANLAIYNMAGQKVRELVMETLSAGKHAAVWNGRDSAGRPVSSGVYIARLMMEGKVESHRMTLVK